MLGRFAVGFRTAAYLTAGILKLPPLKLFLTDLVAASLSTTAMFALGYVFAHGPFVQAARLEADDGAPLPVAGVCTYLVKSLTEGSAGQPS